MKQYQKGLFTENYVQESIDFIREHEPKDEPYFLGFSGGKDSCVLKHLAEVAGVKFESYYSSTGIDPPELVKFIKQNHSDVVFCRPKQSVYTTMQRKGFPTKFSRWCCDELKKYPTKHIELKHRLMGIRAEESSKRAARPRVDKSKFKQVIYKPIFYWREWQIWEYIDENNLPYCKLYDEGFARLGCVVCPFLCYPNSRLLKKSRERWPKIYAAWDRALSQLYQRKEWWRQKVKSYAQTEEEFIQNWYNGHTTINKKSGRSSSQIYQGPGAAKRLKNKKSGKS